MTKDTQGALHMDESAPEDDAPPESDVEVAPEKPAEPWVTKRWADLPIYVCPACQFDTFDVAEIAKHVKRCKRNQENPRA